MGMSRARQIRAILILAGKRQTDIAKKLGVTRQAVNGVIMGRYRSATIEQALVEAGIPKFLLDEEDSEAQRLLEGEAAA